MARDALFPDGVPRPKAPYSPVVRSGDHVYTAGQVAFDASGGLVAGGIAEQTHQALSNIRACLLAAGCTLEDVVKVNVFLVDLADFEAFNDVYRATFTEPYPARTTVQAGLPGGIRVEIEAVARVPPPGS
jgi:2-iminobutanoate/2-iminopropanoate deaminase